MGKKRLVIIDSDSLTYLGKKEDSLQEILEKVDNKIQEILDEARADWYLLALSRGKYFRHELTLKSEDYYKGTRSYTTQPWKQVIKEYLTVKYQGFSLKGVEADDILSYLKSKYFYYCKFTNPHSDSFWMLTTDNSNADKVEEVEVILASKDKDIVKGISGLHLNYDKKLPSGDYGMEWVNTSKEEAELFFKYQLIFGDGGDGIKTPFPENCAIYNTSEVILTIPEIMEGYIYGLTYDTPKRKDQFREGLGLDEGIQKFRLNYLLLKMIDSDEMFLDRVGYIPDISKFPFQKVNKPEEVKQEEIEF